MSQCQVINLLSREGFLSPEGYNFTIDISTDTGIKFPWQTK